MATKGALMRLQSTGCRKFQDARNDQGRDNSPNGDVLIVQIRENMNTTPQEEVLKRIASLPEIRRGKVLKIRRQLTEGTYEVADRLDKATDRVLEAITVQSLRDSCCRYHDSEACNHEVLISGHCE